MKAIHTFCLAFTIVGLIAIWRYWPAIKWYAAHKQLVDSATETADGLQQAGILQ
jgi:hypothetical protein